MKNTPAEDFPGRGISSIAYRPTAVISSVATTALSPDLRSRLLLELRLQVVHRAFDLLVGQGLRLVFEDEAECIRLLAGGQLVALVDVE